MRGETSKGPRGRQPFAVSGAVETLEGSKRNCRFEPLRDIGAHAEMLPERIP